ncbi:AmiS/UreI family transporter [Microbacterium sp. NPDC077391]|uniref:AmiS/UreI family transporter n=1 Tax=Microbacterium sp. NPDC077391 TaxID=3154765 RepID=UPI00341C1D34
MSDIGLFYVGAVLIINGIMLLGAMTARAAAPLNLFVGAMQVITPTVMVMTANDDPAVVFAASGLYLFGFTYLWVGINALADLSATGLGWFSLFVAVAAIGFAERTWAAGGRVFAVIWVLWALLWLLFFLLFFLLLGLGRTHLARFTGAIAVGEGIATAAVPAWLSLTGAFVDSGSAALALAVAAAVGLIVLYLRLGRTPQRVDRTSARRQPVSRSVSWSAARRSGRPAAAPPARTEPDRP